jgi:hypothetical protein
MRSIQGRLSKLEHRFGIADDRERFIVILDGAGSTRALSDDRCIQILDEAGLLHTGGSGVVDLTQIPNGLSAKETERFLRESGAELSSSRRVQSPSALGKGIKVKDIEVKDIDLAAQSFQITLSE